MSGGTLTQLFAQDAQDIYLKGNVDQLATGNFMLYWNQPTRVASGYSYGNGVPNRGQLLSTIPPVKPNNTASYGMGGPNNDMTLNINLVDKSGIPIKVAEDTSRFQQDVAVIQDLENKTNMRKNPYAAPPIRVRTTKPTFIKGSAKGDLIGYSGKSAPGTWDSYDIDQKELQYIKPDLQKINEVNEINKNITDLNKLEKKEKFNNIGDMDNTLYDNKIDTNGLIPSKPGSAAKLAKLGQLASCACMDGNCHNCLRCRMIDCPNCRLGRCPNCQTGNCPLCKLNQKREQGIDTCLPCLAGGDCGFPRKSCSTCIQPPMGDNLIADDLVGDYVLGDDEGIPLANYISSNNLDNNLAPGGSQLGQNLIADELDEIAGVGQTLNNITTRKMNMMEPFTTNITSKKSTSNKLGQQFVCGCMQKRCSGCPTCYADTCCAADTCNKLEKIAQPPDSIYNPKKEKFNNLDNLGTNKLAINVGGQLVCADKSGNCGLPKKNMSIFTNSQDNTSNSSKDGCLSCAHRAVALNGDLFCPCVNGNCDSCEKCKAGLCTQCPRKEKFTTDINIMPSKNNISPRPIGMQKECPCKLGLCDLCKKCKNKGYDTECKQCPYYTEKFMNINEEPNYSYPKRRYNKCDCMRSGCPQCNTANNMSIDLPSFGTWHGGYRLANGWNEATPGLNPVNLTDSLVYYPDSYVGSYFTNPKPDIMKPYPIMPANEPVSSIALNM
jgi:hypothetical protein